MRIPISVEEYGGNRHLFLKVSLIVSLPGRVLHTRFLLDTGASKTLLSEKTAMELGVDYRKLRRDPVPILGFGGRGGVEIYILPGPVLLILKSDDGHDDSVEMDEMRICRITTRDPIQQKLKDIMPNLLGADFLNKSGYVLYYDCRNMIAYLERP